MTKPRLAHLYFFQSVLYQQEIAKLRQALKAKNIDYIFLKGLPLHLYYFKSYPKRFYADCDILIKEHDAISLIRILEKLGYKEKLIPLANEGSIVRNARAEFTYSKLIHHNSILFDIHTQPVFMISKIGSLDNLYPSERTNHLTSDFFSHKRDIRIQKQTYSILSSEDLVMYLALHFFNHGYRGMFRLELIDKVIRQDKINWTIVSKKIKKYKMQNFAYPSYMLLKKYLYTPVPAGFLQSVEPKKHILNYIEANILTINIYSEKLRIDEGVLRFKNLFFLSPEPLWKKVLVVLSPDVLYAIIWVLQRKLSSFFLGQR